ncbi:MAG TPA: ATP-binding protein [Mycobacteriales bacterium]|jgi:anti-sigma regulatory factor (Ser/Thr protein kinase)|nr:ATP-binding protein [Mycobacteriales bacterium]
MELLELPFDAASASVARRHVVHVLRTRGVAAVTREDAALIVSEFVGNALRHGRPLRGGRIRVGWQFDDAGLSIEVTDGGSGRPAVRSSTDALSMTGRGLGIVASLADEWGYAAEPDGTLVWARLHGLDLAEYAQTG